MTHHELRKRYFDFFAKQGHLHVPEVSLTPDSDPTLLFTVAGMQQFKAFYEHPEDAPSSRIVNIQPCIRTVDIDEVGDDTHSTVFEMMGFFSFGYTGEAPTALTKPYFKADALRLAWDFFTKELGYDATKLRLTYFGGDAQRPEDTASLEILKTFEGLSLIEPTLDDNFWGPVGSEGPCGPCVEFYLNDVEIGNVVFNEYFRDREGNYSRLEYQGVDTGLGFDRNVMMVQNKSSIYETDLLAAACQFVEKNSYAYTERHCRIIVDHAKAALYLLTDGVKPGNKGRDYVVRRLIRRAARAGELIGFKDFAGLLETLSKEFGPYRSTIAENVLEAIELFGSERDKFLKTLQQGMIQLQKIMQGERNGEVTGEQAFHLFDTYGFPIELTQEIAEESGWTVDSDGFEAAFAKHREKSRLGMDKMFQGGLADHEEHTVAHHTAHHLLLAALRMILGDHVVQRGSNVTQERLRIDVAHGEKINDEQLKMVEELVNQKIEEDLPVISEVMDRDEALKLGALAEFGAKYPKDASVYTIIDQGGEVFSREFCGGPHVNHTGELGRFEILKEEASSAGVRRIRARVIPRG